MKRGRLYARYKIDGAEVFYVAERLHALKVPVYDLVESKNGVILSIDFADRKKLFAISRNMCYNITKIKYYGKLSPLFAILSHLGIAVCFLSFGVIAAALDGLVTKVEYKGDGQRYSVVVNEILREEGIEKNCLLPRELKPIESRILNEVDGLSFVSLKKSGRILTVELYLAEVRVEPIDTRKKSIVSTVNGEILRLNILSGSPLFSVGDRVKVGDEVIVGYYERDGERIESYALGEVLVKAEYVYSYQSFAKGEKYKDRAMLLARQSLGEADELEIKVKEKQSGDKFIYEVTVIYLVALS